MSGATKINLPNLMGPSIVATTTTTTTTSSSSSSTSTNRSTTADCRKFTANIFNKSKCSHCFRQREEHSAQALESNRVTRKVSKCGYLFVAPDWDFSNPLYRSKRWQRRWFVLYDDGEVTYSVDDHPETVPQACIDMTKVLEVSTAEDVTGHLNSLAITAPDRVTFVKGTCPEETKWWLNILSAFPKTKGRHKRNATFPGGQATTILQSQQSVGSISGIGRNRHNSYHRDMIPSSVTNLETIQAGWITISTTTTTPTTLSTTIITNGSTSKSSAVKSNSSSPVVDENNINANNNNRENQRITEILNLSNFNKNMNGWNTIYSGNINKRCAIGNYNQLQHDDSEINEENYCQEFPIKIQMRPKSLQLSSTTPSIVSAIIKKPPPPSSAGTIPSLSVTATTTTTTPILPNNLILQKNTLANNNNNSNESTNLSSLTRKQQQQQQSHERGDPDGGCNIDDMSVTYLSKTSELRVNLTTEEALNTKKGWLMKQDLRNGEWTKHWFILRGAALFYYRDPTAEERGVLDGVLDVNGITSVSEVSIAKNYGFQLITWDKRKIILSTISVNSRNNWVNILRSAAGLTASVQQQQQQQQQPQQQQQDQQNQIEKLQIIGNNSITDDKSQSVHSVNTKEIIKENTSDDLMRDIENNLIKGNQLQHHHHQQQQISNDGIIEQMSIINTNKRLQQPQQTTPLTPNAPKSLLFSSDEEYRTASEGGRRDSVDWGSPLSVSPSIPLSSSSSSCVQQYTISGICKSKDLRSRSNSGTRMSKRSKSSPPSSRRSTVDSICSDELMIHPVQEEIHIEKDLQLRLSIAEKELNSLKHTAQERENKTIELLTTLDRTKLELSNRIRDAEESKENFAHQLLENSQKAEEIIDRLTIELNETHRKCKDIEERLGRGIIENESLYKKIHELETICIKNNNNDTTQRLLLSPNLNRSKVSRINSLSDLTSLNDINPYALDRDRLPDEYTDLKVRFEKAIAEIRAMKKELRESQNQYDILEMTYDTLKKDMQIKQFEDNSQIQMMSERIQDLTSKYSSSERQVRLLKQKLVKSEKKRSLSLKGRESMTIQKELEDKFNELEIKIDALENLTDRTSSTPSPSFTPSPAPIRHSKTFSDLSSTHTPAGILRTKRRKSLDSSATEAMQVLIRLNNLEKRIENRSSLSGSGIDNLTDDISISNTESINSLSKSSPKLSDHLIERLKSLENVVITSKEHIEQCLQQLQYLKLTKSRRSVSPISDRKDSYKFIEKTLSESVRLLRDTCDKCLLNDYTRSGIVSPSASLPFSPETNPIKQAVYQLETQLRQKLNDLLKQRRFLREHNQLTTEKTLELIAERIAYESICFGKLRDAVTRAEEPNLFGECQTQAEAVETQQLICTLKSKLNGRFILKSSDNINSVDILTSVLARRLVLSMGRFKNLKIPKMSVINSKILDELLCQQNELHLIIKHYKINAMENLANGLAIETFSYLTSTSTASSTTSSVTAPFRSISSTISDTATRTSSIPETTSLNNSIYVQGMVQDAWRLAQETVNIELVESEIANILLRNTARFEQSLTIPSFGYTLTTPERISFENFSDAVQDALRKEMDLIIKQLQQCYQEHLSKMRQGKWHFQLEQIRKPSEERQLLAEFSDIMAHKALIDARISVLKGDYQTKDTNFLINDSNNNNSNNNNNNNNINSNNSNRNTFSLITLEKYENLFAELATDLQLSHPHDILAEADFNFMYKYFTTEFLTSSNEIQEVFNVVQKLEQTILILQSNLNPNKSISIDANGDDVDVVDNKNEKKLDYLKTICRKCQQLQKRIEQQLIPSVQKLQLSSCTECVRLQLQMDQLKKSHKIELKELIDNQDLNIQLSGQQLKEQIEKSQRLEDEKLEILTKLQHEHNLVEKFELQINEINDKLEKCELDYRRAYEGNLQLLDELTEERQKSALMKNDSVNLLEKFKAQTDEYNAMLRNRDLLQDAVRLEKERVRKLEKKLEIIEQEHQQQIENLHVDYKGQEHYITNISNNNNESQHNIERNQDDNEDEQRIFKQRYQSEIEQLRTLCEKGLVAMESSHRRIINDLEEKHRQEIQRLTIEKDQALAEETQATLAALDAMRKAHQNEVQREISRFKTEFVRQFQKCGETSSFYKEEEELDDVRQEILSLSEKYSIKCVEAATFEEKCHMATQQLKQFQLHIQQLENRNKQLRAHLISSDAIDFNLPPQQQPPPIPKDLPPQQSDNEHVTDVNKSCVINCSKENLNLYRPKEIHPRLTFNEGIKLAAVNESIIMSDSNKLSKQCIGCYMTSSLSFPSSSLNNNKESTNSKKSITNVTIEDQFLLDHHHHHQHHQYHQHHNKSVIKLCSLPPLDGKEIEHIRRFELEI